ncbi:MAG: hypothetical protein V3V13_13030 [Paracoccaceae bacterium]
MVKQAGLNLARAAFTKYLDVGGQEAAKILRDLLVGYGYYDVNEAQRDTAEEFDVPLE